MGSEGVSSTEWSIGTRVWCSPISQTWRGLNNELEKDSLSAWSSNSVRAFLIKNYCLIQIYLVFLLKLFDYGKNRNIFL